jgi:murein DD-endopeptidase MepM/ murein hydrolase activator NlpD
MIRARPRTRGLWLLHASAGAGVVAFAFLSGAWAFTSHFLRYAAVLLFLAAAVHSYRRRKTRESGSFLPASLAAVFGTLTLLALAARIAPAGGLDARFPLAGGDYYVLQGGDSVVTNPFHAASGTPLALDIVKLNAVGNRARGVAPPMLEAYAIYGEAVLSPCDGLVVRIREGHADNPPAHPDTAGGSGNHVVVRCGEAEILLGHLLKGSIGVTPNAPVEAGQPLGKVGNSGHSMEPHLHVDASVQGKGIALLFRGRFLSAGDIQPMMVHARTVGR